jgi:hypothetical protein
MPKKKTGTIKEEYELKLKKQTLFSFTLIKTPDIKCVGGFSIATNSSSLTNQVSCDSSQF